MGKWTGSKHMPSKIGNISDSAEQSFGDGLSQKKYLTCSFAFLVKLSAIAWATHSAFSDTIGNKATTAPVRPLILSTLRKESASSNAESDRRSTAFLWFDCPITGMQHRSVASTEIAVYSVCDSSSSNCSENWRVSWNIHSDVRGRLQF